MTLDDARLFVAIGRADSLSSAAREVGCSPAAASAGLQRLERTTRVRLVRRTTRTMELTAEGRQLLETCQTLLRVWADGEQRLHQAQRSLAGEIRLAAPVDLAQQHVGAWVASFVERHPTVRVTVLVGDATQALPGDDVDVALRYGVLEDSTLVATRLCNTDRTVVAAPGYLRRRGHPTHPRELGDHRALAWLRHGRPHTRWVLSRGEEVGDVDVVPALCGDGALVRGWAVAGEGLACKGRLDVVDDLVAGRLVEVLPDWDGEEVPLMAVLPAGRLRTARVEALVEHLREQVTTLVTRSSGQGPVSPVGSASASVSASVSGSVFPLPSCREQ
ncbi:MAG: LysR family transcriptional regulator [Alphaproteobacteria bacterium]|nr:LysR family transcriptional regulator [Alphaproteobacteria bacterium]MCB9688136.1 LysR family transcriptional regulator [Alphaproteobacteria bacterium]